MYVCVSHSVVVDSDPMDCSPPDSSVHGILQVRILACMPRHLSHVQFFATRWTMAHQAPLSMESFRQEYWSG